MLERGGFVNRQRRPRTTVSRRKVVRASSALSLRGGLERQGLELQTRLLRYQRAVVPRVRPGGLRLPAGSKVGSLRPLRFIDDQVMGYDAPYLPPSAPAASILHS